MTITIQNMRFKWFLFRHYFRERMYNPRIFRVSPIMNRGPLKMSKSVLFLPHHQEHHHPQKRQTHRRIYQTSTCRIPILEHTHCAIWNARTFRESISLCIATSLSGSRRATALGRGIMWDSCACRTGERGLGAGRNRRGECEGGASTGGNLHPSMQGQITLTEFKLGCEGTTFWGLCCGDQCLTVNWCQSPNKATNARLVILGWLKGTPWIKSKYFM